MKEKLLRPPPTMSVRRGDKLRDCMRTAWHGYMNPQDEETSCFQLEKIVKLRFPHDCGTTSEEEEEEETGVVLGSDAAAQCVVFFFFFLPGQSRAFCCVFVPLD